MTDATHRTSMNFAIAQTVLLCVFAAVNFLYEGPRLMPAGGWPGAIGAVLCVTGLVLMLSAFGPLKRAIQIRPEPKAGAELVTSGVYGRFRHPIYTGILILVVGLFLRRATVAVGITSIVVIAFLVVKARYEETLLLARYPDYAAYRTRTWGIIPGLR